MNVPTFPRLRSAAAPLLLAVLAACGDDDSPTEPRLECAALAVGEVATLEGAEAADVCVRAPDSAGEYVLVPFFASRSGTARLAVEVAGTGVEASAPASADAVRRADLPLLPEAGPVEDDLFHYVLRAREKATMEWLMGLGTGGAGASRSARPAPPAAQTVGETVRYNVSADCDDVDLRTGRVAAVSERAVVVLDTANPAGGFGPAEAREFAEAFDTLVYRIDVRNFGEPTDIDGNGRAIVFFTRAVNELTPPGSDSFVGGFFWAGDLFPREATAQLGACPGSNTAEMFYMLVPDPQGAAGNAFELDFVRNRTVGVLAHEFQHLINASRRIRLNPGDRAEEVWLNEALSHVAEELLFYETSGLGPRSNVGLDELQRSQAALDAFVAYGLSNVGRYRRYVENPDEESLLGIDGLPTRGASWAFLRYAADLEPGDDADLFRRLVDGSEAGVENLAAALEADPLDRMQSWTVSVYTDDAVPGVADLYRQPSWDFRSLLPALDPAAGFPLDVETLAEGEQAVFSLRGGGAAFVRFGVAAGGEARLEVTSGGAAPPGTLRLSVVRTR